MEEMGLIVSLLNSSKGFLTHDERMPPTALHFYKTSSHETTCMDLGHSNETGSFVAAGGIDNELRVIDVRRPP